MRMLPFPDLFLSAATCRPPEFCDSCKTRFDGDSEYQVMKIFAVDADRTRERQTEYELVTCEKCLRNASRAIKPQSKARVIEWIDEKIAELAVISDFRFGGRTLERLFKDLMSGEDPAALDNVLSLCRLCRQDATSVRTGFRKEHYTAVARFVGQQMAVTGYRYLSFEQPVVVCGCCDKLAADQMSESQRGAVDEIYTALNAPPHDYRPVLPFFADSNLATMQEAG